MRGYWEKPEETAKKLRPGPLPGELVAELPKTATGKIEKTGLS